MNDTGLLLAFIGVVAITTYQVAGNELKDFINNISNIENAVQQRSLEQSRST